MSSTQVQGGTDPQLKSQVRDYWDRASCGEVYAVGDDTRRQYETHAETRYRLEPYIREFARFHEGRDKDVLEIGVGMGADHLEWAKSGPRSLTGVDLTPRAIEHTQKRCEVFGFQSNLRTDDAENLSFPDNSFDVVFSWGVLHHSPNTPKAFEEVRRVLRPGGVARIMIYHYYGMVGYMLWARYALMRGKPFRSLADVYAHHLESPGTKSYTVAEARRMTKAFSKADIRVMLSFGDLLQGEVGQRHRGVLLSTAKALWPRWFIRTFMKNHGHQLLIEVTK